jgi:hypothetical protein
MTLGQKLLELRKTKVENNMPRELPLQVLNKLKIDSVEYA